MRGNRSVLSTLLFTSVILLASCAADDAIQAGTDCNEECPVGSQMTSEKEADGSCQADGSFVKGIGVEGKASGQCVGSGSCRVVCLYPECGEGQNLEITAESFVCSNDPCYGWDCEGLLDGVKHGEHDTTQGGGCKCVCYDGYVDTAKYCNPVDKCIINGDEFEDGDTDPVGADGVCRVCTPSISQSSWTSNDGAPCPDSDICTINETCEDGQCVSKPKLCNDNNPCTQVDRCDPEDGCVFTNEIVCDLDGDWCNGVEYCDEDPNNPAVGQDRCVTTGNPCAQNDDGQFCNGAEADACQPTGNNTGNCLGSVERPCNDDASGDGLYCNGDETCVEGEFVPICGHTGDPCADGDSCNNTCNEALGDCFSPSGADCDDLVFCNGTDTCDGSGTCGQHTGNPCPDDQLWCTGVESCDPVLHCVSEYDDGDNPRCQQNGTFCDGVEYCDESTHCTSPGNPCLSDEVCDEGFGICICEGEVIEAENDFDKRPRVARMVADGPFVVVWHAEDLPGDAGFGIYVQMFDYFGSKVGDIIHVNTTTANDQMYPDVAMTSTGGFVVTWQGYDVSSRGIYAQRFDSDGDPVGAEFSVNTTTTGSQENPDIAINADDDFVVVWESGSGGGIFGQRYNSAGVAQGGEMTISSGPNPSGGGNPSVSMDPDGYFVVAYEKYSALTGADIFAKQFSPAGVLIGSEFEVNTTENSDQSRPYVDVNSLGDFFIAWASSDGAPIRVMGQMFLADGSKLLDEKIITPNGDNPAVGMEETDDFFLVFQAYDGDDQGIWGRYYRYDDFWAFELGSAFAINSITENQQVYPAIDVDGDGDAAVVWDYLTNGVWGTTFQASNAKECWAAFW